MAAADLSNGSCVRQARVDHAAVNVRLLLMLLMSFVVLTVQLPQLAHAAVLRIPTGTWTEHRQPSVIDSVSVELRIPLGI